jgi:EpsI family protein
VACRIMTARLAWLLILFTVAFASVGWLQWRSNALAPKPIGKLDVEIPLEFGTWTGVETPVEDETVQVLKAYSHFNRRYNSINGASMLLHAANWENGYTISPAPHHPEVCYQAAGWKIIERRMVTCDYPEGPFPMELILFESRGNRVVTAHWFQTGGVRYANLAQFSKERNRFLASRKWPGTEKFLLQVSKPTINEAEPILIEFAKELLASRQPESATAS